MPITLSTSVGSEARNQIMGALESTGEPMTTSQLYPHVTVIKSINDLSTIIKMMIDNGDIVRSDDKVKVDGMLKWTYRLRERTILSEDEIDRLESELVKEIDDAPATMVTADQEGTDPLFAVIDQLPLSVWVPDGMQRAARLRRLAGRLEAAAPDLAAELYEDASILEDLAA